MRTIIKLNDVIAGYMGEQIPTIRDVNLEVAEGDFLAVIGPNAVGKTTLLETIIGLIKPTKGTIEILGRNLLKEGSLLRRSMGYVPQEAMFDPDTPFTVEDFVMMGKCGQIGIFRSPSKQDRRKVSKALAEMNISHLAKRPIGKLSGGELKKAFIARVLAKRAEIILLDEPFNNLDFVSRKGLLDLMLRLFKDTNFTVLTVLHELDYLKRFDRLSGVLLMDEGKIVKRGDVDTVLESKEFNKAFGLK